MSAASPTVRSTGRTTRNLTRTLVDTALSRFAKTETRVQYLTNGGDPASQKRAEDGTDAANALLEQTDSERHLRRAALHAGVFDLGAVKRIDAHGGPEVEHTPSWELMFEPADAHRGKPTILTQRFPADREALIDAFARPEDDDDEEELQRKRELAADIRDASAAGLMAVDHTETQQHVLCYELWRLPVGRTKGRHIVVTEGQMLLDEQWTDKTFPFSFFGWSAPLFGAYPESIAAIVSGLQDELDGLKTRKSQIIRLCAVPRYQDNGPPAGPGQAPAVQSAQIRGGSDAIGDLVSVPTGHTLTPIPTGVGDSLASVIQAEKDGWSDGFSMTGISEQSAVGSRPAGLNSAPAQREWNEINQDRLSLVALEYQQAHVDLADQLLKAIAELPDYEISIKSPNGEWLRKMKAAELNLADADYVIQRFPIGALPTTPTGKLAAAADLLQMQAIQPDEFREMVNFPDLKAKLTAAAAARKAAEKLVNRMLQTGRYEPPPQALVADPNQSAAKYALTRLLEGIADDMPEDRLQLLQDWMDEIDARQKQAAQEAAPPPSRAGTSIAPIQPAPLAPVPDPNAPPPGAEMAAA